MEIWALHLPQFYETKENNEWWGKGFTEWTNVRKAKPLYKNHEQPAVPLNNNYYDLTNKEAIRWQTELAQEYGVTGFVYFHYWYCGRHLLEKPCEILLESEDIKMDYCFCWANHSWTRAWDGKNHEILVEQKYGDKDEWEAHLQYLLPFFKDKRYIKKEGKPVLFLYNAKSLENANERVEYWNSRLIEEGFEGIFIVEYINTFNTSPSIKSSKAVFEDEPNYTCRFEINVFNKAKRVMCKLLKITDYQNYDNLWKIILKKKATYEGRKIILGGFPCWDNSPRKGKNSRVIKGASPEKFKKYLSKLAHSQRKDSLDIILLNAWNEWGEGAMLEPTEKHKYRYLEAVKSVVQTTTEKK